jgi:hypothetical protein
MNPIYLPACDLWARVAMRVAIREVQISLTFLTLFRLRVACPPKKCCPLASPLLIFSEMGMGSPDNRREADDSCNAFARAGEIYVQPSPAGP